MVNGSTHGVLNSGHNTKEAKEVERQFEFLSETQLLDGQTPRLSS